MLGILMVGIYRGWTRSRHYLFSRIVRGAFASFGARSVIELPVRLGGEASIAIGAGVFIGAGSWLQVLGVSSDNHRPALQIGDGTSIAGSCVLSAAHSIRIGRKVLLARNVYIADHGHEFESPPVPVLEQGIRSVGAVEIGDGAWLGQNVFVGPGVRIGRGAVIGANSVVLADVPDFAVAVGVPARVLRTFGDQVELERS